MIAAISEKRVQRSQRSCENTLVCHRSDRSDRDHCNRWDEKFSMSAILAIVAIEVFQMETPLQRSL